jgi:hypothetical protein
MTGLLHDGVVKSLALFEMASRPTVRHALSVVTIVSDRKMQPSRPTLSELRISNFKAFGSQQTIPIRPLTLIYGANSSGKSSIIHSLLYTTHAQETGYLDVYRTKRGGSSVDLGGFRQVIHGQDPSANLGLGFDWIHGPLYGRKDWFAPFSRSGLDFSVGLPPLGGAFSPTPSLQLCKLALDGVPFMSFTPATIFPPELLKMLYPQSELAAQKFLAQFEDQALEHPVSRLLMESLFGTPIEGSKEERKRQWVELRDVFCASEPRFQRQGICPHFSLTVDEIEREAEAGLRDETIVEALDRGAEILRVVEELAGMVIEPVHRNFSQLLDSLLYLGPVRFLPPRSMTEIHDNDPEWFSGGGRAWRMLLDDPELTSRVNQWLGSEHRLQTPYRIFVERPIKLSQMKDLLAQELERTIDRSTQAKAEPVTGEVETLMNRLSERAAKSHSPMLEIMDLRTNALVSPRDIGMGVSQVLPVLVAAFASRQGIIAIEQPELHLHPALQSELGDVFIESALGDRKNTFLLETHSEHLVLRILRRIRETTENKLPEGKTPVRPEDVAVLYVQPGANGAEVIELPVTPDGDFGRPWPGGFFAERFQELP